MKLARVVMCANSGTVMSASPTLSLLVLVGALIDEEVTCRHFWPTPVCMTICLMSASFSCSLLSMLIACR
ncbi:hypothetical protein BCR37DRAFT_379494 [Protomyces lactucae-debilis]|uniref:Uncharacterized protein n=1 Tax=Protomyces lactucae-debilis TaxID=2754530 RepID=A0A1Y2FFV8_PROLT|nr:uncharacterized protein BCR37DRAFT_379494 [Protomyces lactucae-debilis]ORY82497.1 hypothetical protein BCR37DRAFT_379494 [Protomyces lactucae-debilis]